MMDAIAQRDDRRNASTGELFAVADKTVYRWMNKHGVSARRSSPIDPQRAAQATTELRDHWFYLIEVYVKRLYLAKVHVHFPKVHVHFDSSSAG